jgi:hypothetical protein
VIWAAFGSQTHLQVSEAGDGSTVGVDAGVIKGALKCAHDFLTQHVLNLLGVIVHMVGRNLGLIG